MRQWWRHFRLSLSLSLSVCISLSLSLSPKVPHAQYRKRFRASYIKCPFSYDVALRSEFTLSVHLAIPDVDCSPCADSSWRSIDHLIAMVKNRVEKNVRKIENLKRSRWFVSKTDEDVVDSACENACVKLANTKSVKRVLPERHSQATTTPALASRVTRFIAQG